MTDGGTYLDKILAAKRAELEHDNRTVSALEAQLSGLPPTMNFMSALRRTIRPCAIAEFKRASPSEGVIRERAEPVEIAAQCGNKIRGGGTGRGHRIDVGERRAELAVALGGPRGLVRAGDQARLAAVVHLDGRVLDAAHIFSAGLIWIEDPLGLPGTVEHELVGE